MPLEIFDLSSSIENSQKTKSRGSNAVSHDTNRQLSAPNANIKERKITKLSAGVKDPNRINVFIDGKFRFSLALAQVADAKLKIGMIISEEREAELISASEFGKLYQRTLEWVLMRPRSERELRDYLRRRQFKRIQTNRQRANNAARIAAQKAVRTSLATKQLPEISDEHCERVFQEILEHGYVDDQRFTEFYIENRNIKKGISERRMRQELQQKGVSQQIIDQVLQSSERNEVDEIQKIIAKKRSRYDDTKLLQYLVRQGFSYDLAKNAVAESESNTL